MSIRNQKECKSHRKKQVFKIHLKKNYVIPYLEERKNENFSVKIKRDDDNEGKLYLMEKWMLGESAPRSQVP